MYAPPEESTRIVQNTVHSQKEKDWGMHNDKHSGQSFSSFEQVLALKRTVWPLFRKYLRNVAHHLYPEHGVNGYCGWCLWPRQQFLVEQYMPALLCPWRKPRKPCWDPDKSACDTVQYNMTSCQATSAVWRLAVEVCREVGSPDVGTCGIAGAGAELPGSATSTAGSALWGCGYGHRKPGNVTWSTHART